MNIIMIERAEVVCAIILFTLLIYSITYFRRNNSVQFIRMCCYALGHVIFDIITVYTVNAVNVIPAALNKACHLLFIYFAILFSYELFAYTIEQRIAEKQVRIIKRIGQVIVGGYIIAAPFLEIEYVKGNGTNYSAGACIRGGYIIAFTFSIVAVMFLIIGVKKIRSSTQCIMAAMSVIMLGCMTVQIIVPEILFTGAALTFVVMGIFFTLENPARMFMEKAYTDIETGVRNRNCFDEDMECYGKRLQSIGNGRMTVGIIVCDLNGLKSVNDKSGHAAGDKLIRSAAHVLKMQLKNARDVYRTGGDEFVAIYTECSAEMMEKDIEAVRTACEMDNKHRISIAIGYAISSPNTTLAQTYQQADIKMYENKLDIKSKEKEKVQESE